MSKKDTYKNLMDKTVLSRESKANLKNLANNKNNIISIESEKKRPKRKFAIPAIAAALVLTVLCGSVIGTSLYGNGSANNSGNSFFISAYAADASVISDIPLTEEKQVLFYSDDITINPISYKENGEIVTEDNYRIDLSAFLKCTGENIDSVTYTGNGVNFNIDDTDGVTVNQEDIIREYSGFEIDKIFNGISGGIGEVYCNKFTIDYSKLNSEAYGVSIWSVPDTSDPETAQAVSNYRELDKKSIEDKLRQMEEDKANGENIDSGGAVEHSFSNEEFLAAVDEMIKHTLDGTSIDVSVKFNDGTAVHKKINIFYEKTDSSNGDSDTSEEYAVLTNLTD